MILNLELEQVVLTVSEMADELGCDNRHYLYPLIKSLNLQSCGVVKVGPAKVDAKCYSIKEFNRLKLAIKQVQKLYTISPEQTAKNISIIVEKLNQQGMKTHVINIGREK